MKRNSLLHLGAVFIILLGTVLPFQARAISPSTISIEMAPLNPTAGENTTITLGSYASNLDGVSISWFVGGRKTTSGIGVKSFSLAAPSTGSETTVRAVIVLPDGEIEKKVIIKPSVMVLLSQAIDSYVPPFYRGKAMPTADSSIKVVAMPEIKLASGMVNAKNMLYAWKRNYTNETEASGYGKNSFTFINDYLEDGDTISVTASTIDGQHSSQANIDITPSQPQISFYKNDSRLGTIWEQALSNGHRIQGDEIVVAEPYFISPKEIWSSSLAWRWFINGSLTNNTLDYRKNWLPIKVEGGVSGVSTVGLELENTGQLFGATSKQISVEF
jgi:hypothetical protein